MFHPALASATRRSRPGSTTQKKWDQRPKKRRPGRGARRSDLRGTAARSRGLTAGPLTAGPLTRRATASPGHARPVFPRRHRPGTAPAPRGDFFTGPRPPAQWPGRDLLRTARQSERLPTHPVALPRASLAGRTCIAKGAPRRLLLP